MALPFKDALAGRRVLVIEDEALIALMLEDFLMQAGAIVIGLAASVAQALKLIEGEQVDVAVLDYAIADGVSVPVAEALIARSVPFLFASGHTPPGITPTFAAAPTIERALRAGEAAENARRSAAVQMIPETDIWRALVIVQCYGAARHNACAEIPSLHGHRVTNRCRGGRGSCLGRRGCVASAQINHAVT